MKKNLLIFIAVIFVVAFFAKPFIQKIVRGATTMTCADTMSFLMSVPSPDSEQVFALFEGGDLSGPSWYVFKFKKDQDLKVLRIPNTNKDIVPTPLLTSHEGACSRCAQNPNISIAGGRFLVFSRGGLKVGLYDIKADVAVVNEYNPDRVCGANGDDATYACMKNTLDAKIGAVLQAEEIKK